MAIGLRTTLERETLKFLHRLTAGVLIVQRSFLSVGEKKIEKK